MRGEEMEGEGNVGKRRTNCVYIPAPPTPEVIEVTSIDAE